MAPGRRSAPWELLRPTCEYCALAGGTPSTPPWIATPAPRTNVVRQGAAACDACSPGYYAAEFGSAGHELPRWVVARTREGQLRQLRPIHSHARKGPAVVSRVGLDPGQATCMLPRESRAELAAAIGIHAPRPLKQHGGAGGPVHACALGRSQAGAERRAWGVPRWILCGDSRES